ncbi:MAG: hypothetical protein KDA81_15945 [Planctomycetaceae bacterium]|nr:hypothetical protein [Planctomycetaceae bacterium]MCA9085553.1 hypothetical protein [Planctomycetaceae bacterium]
MKLPHSLSTFAVLCAASVSAHAADDLFSSVRNGSAFAENLVEDSGSEQQNRESGTAKNPTEKTTESPTSLDEVKGLLQDTKATEVSSKDEYLTAMFAHEGWEFPVLVILDTETQNLHLFLGLSVIDDESQVTSTQVFRLLQASQEIAPLEGQ